MPTVLIIDLKRTVVLLEGGGVGAFPDTNYSFGIQRFANSFSRQGGPILFDIDLRVVGGVTRPDLHMRCKLV